MKMKKKNDRKMIKKYADQREVFRASKAASDADPGNQQLRDEADKAKDRLDKYGLKIARRSRIQVSFKTEVDALADARERYMQDWVVRKIFTKLRLEVSMATKLEDYAKDKYNLILTLPTVPRED